MPSDILASFAGNTFQVRRWSHLPGSINNATTDDSHGLVNRNVLVIHSYSYKYIIVPLLIINVCVSILLQTLANITR